jgi:hypothetical protein
MNATFSRAVQNLTPKYLSVFKKKAAYAYFRTDKGFPMPAGRIRDCISARICGAGTGEPVLCVQSYRWERWIRIAEERQTL